MKGEVLEKELEMLTTSMQAIRGTTTFQVTAKLAAATVSNIGNSMVLANNNDAGGNATLRSPHGSSILANRRNSYNQLVASGKASVEGSDSLEVSLLTSIHTSQHLHTYIHQGIPKATFRPKLHSLT